jgi:C-terminal processing protease CtpA/Prc
VADIIVAWSVLQHFYPYFDVVDTDWDAVLEASLRRSLAGRTAEDYAAALEGLVSALRDGHGMAAGVRPVPRGQLPIRVEWIEDQVVVVASRTDDIHMGDVIERLDDLDARALVNEAASRTSGSERWRRWRVLPAFGAGADGSVASLRVRGDEGTRTVQVTRTPTAPPPEDRPEPIARIGGNVRYVDLSRATIEAFRIQAPELAAAAGVVFDLRGYPNGTHLALTYLSDQPLQSAFWRVPQTIRPDREGDLSYRESRWNLPPSRPRLRGRIAFLTDGRAISYAESVMGIVEHYKLGEIVGEATAGANGNVNVIPLPSGARVAFTGMRVVKHDGSQHHLIGIQPTVPLTRTIAGVRAGRDELLERAVAIVTGGGR